MSEHHTILGGKVHVYRRPNSSSWQCATYLGLPITHKKAGTNHLIHHPRRRHFGAQTPQS
jgi:hypothetical protein